MSTVELWTFFAPASSVCIKAFFPSPFHRIVKSCSQAPIHHRSLNNGFRSGGSWKGIAPPPYHACALGLGDGTADVLGRVADHGLSIKQGKSQQSSPSTSLCCALLCRPAVPNDVAGQVALAGVDGLVLPIECFSCRNAPGCLPKSRHPQLTRGPSGLGCGLSHPVYEGKPNASHMCARIKFTYI